MAKVKGSFGGDEKPRDGDRGPVTAENWLDRVSGFLRLGGVPFVIRALDGEKGALRTKFPATEPQWIAWRSYLISKRVPVRAMDVMGMTTVPCEYPELFDPDAPVSDPFARLPRRAPAELDRMSGKLSGLFAGLTREVGAWPGDKRQRRQSGAQAKAAADAFLATKVAEWSAPVKLSEAAQKDMAIRAAVEDGEIDF